MLRTANRRRRWQRSAKKMTWIPNEWLQRQASVEDFELEALQRKSDSFSIPLAKVESRFGDQPFGHMTEAWKKFTSVLEPDDQLWFFSSPAESFAKKLGCTQTLTRFGIEISP